jgi:adenylate cyclase
MVLGDSLEQRFGLWGLFYLRGARAGAEDIVIIALMSDTGDRISLPRQRSEQHPCADLRVDEVPETHRAFGDVPQRWGRCHFVELMRRFNAAKPSVVAFDVAFRPRDDLQAGEDRALGAAMGALQNVIVAQKIKLRWLPGRIAVEDGPIELSGDIAKAALGVAPTPLPRQPFDRVDSFQTFKDGPWSAPTLPSLALQVHALDVYPSVLSALRRHTPDAAADLPPDSMQLTRDGQLEVHMLHLRSLLLPIAQDTHELDRLRNSASAGLDPAQTRKLRALFSLYTRGSSRYLNPYGPPGTIRTIHIADVLSVRESVAATDPLRLHDKAVFVGYSDNREWEIVEKFPTVFGDGLTKTSGVELLATAFANLLDDSDLTPAPPWSRLAVAFVAGCATALVCYALTTFSATLMVLLAAGMYLGCAVLLLSRLNLWLPIFVPLAVAVPSGFIFALTCKLAHYKADRAKLRGILEKFVPPDVRALMEQNSKQLERVKETVPAACIMTDIEGFTALSTRMPSEKMLELLRGYFTAIFKPIADFGGFVVDLKGDSMLAVWPDRNLDPVVRDRALRACLELQAAVGQFNSDHPEARMPTRVGANYGVITLAPVGSPSHHVGFSAVGDTVNAGSRIEELGKDLGSYLLVAAAMTDGLSQFLVRDVGEFSLRGRSTPTRILEVLGIYADAPAERIALCRRFAEAKKAFDTSDLKRARSDFKSILKDFPEDGPSKYFARLLERRPPAARRASA